MIIASGTSSRHIQSLSEKVLNELKLSGVQESRIEGEKSSDWKLVDGIDLIVHAIEQFEDGFIFDLASNDDFIINRSIKELDRLLKHIDKFQDQVLAFLRFYLK